MKERFLGCSAEDLRKAGGIHTAAEISSQPKLWLKVYELIKEKSGEISSFLNNIDDNPTVILTGAGTSAFIGEVLEGVFTKHTGFNTKAIATTDIVTHPDYCFPKDKPTLLISFARSGNSPESIKTVALAEQTCPKVYHLIITCNPEGKLAKIKPDSNTYVLLMPPETDDKSLAMTSSFTSMLLAGILIARIQNIEALQSQIELLYSYGMRILDEFTGKLKIISELNFKRAVFLGSGLLAGIAHESHLKLQELTDGRVICKHDSFLGFRHGPKAVIDKDTLIVYLFSNKEYVLKYEKDLFDSINGSGIVLHSVGVMEKDLNSVTPDSKIILSDLPETLAEDFLTVVSVMPAQILGFFKSINLCLQPDTPSKSGTISRVVEGVKLYSYNG